MRKLASIRRVSNLSPIKDADLIECAHVDGWMVVVKKEEFQVNDLCVYIEVDSWVPHELAPFLTPKDQEPKEFNGIKGNRLRTKKLKQQISQGLLLPLSSLNNVMVEEHQDMTDILGIQLYEKPLPPELIGKARGSYPSYVPKTDLDRLQNLKSKFNNFQQGKWCTTEKLHGVSATFILDLHNVFHVCSKNMDILPDEHNVYWKAAIKYSIEETMRHTYSPLLSTSSLKGIAIQGEIIGEGLTGGNYYSQLLDFYVFGMYSIQNGSFLLPADVQSMCKELGLKHVPIIEIDYSISEHTIYSLLEMADGMSVINPKVPREGLVFKSTTDTSLSFKVVSNKWLLKHE
jgi:RNA ligase (TIGR02306 family)